MTNVNAIEYVTREEATARCKAFAAVTPGSVLHNYATLKAVRTADNRTTLYECSKLNVRTVKANPELKGLWKQEVK